MDLYIHCLINLNLKAHCLDISSLIATALMDKTQTTSLWWTWRPWKIKRTSLTLKRTNSDMKQTWRAIWSTGDLIRLVLLTAGSRRSRLRGKNTIMKLLFWRGLCVNRGSSSLAAQVITRSAGQICLTFSVSSDSWFKLPGGPLTAKASLIGALIRPIMQLIS